MENDASPTYVILSAVILFLLLFDTVGVQSIPSVGVIESKSSSSNLGNTGIELKQAVGGLYTYNLDPEIMPKIEIGKEAKIYKSAILQRTMAIEQNNQRYSNALSKTNILVAGVIFSLLVFVGGYVYLSIASKSRS